MSRYAEFCTQCGNALSGEDRFCLRCGAEADEVASAETEATPNDAGPAGDGCPQCGAVLNGGEYCVSCGHRVAAPLAAHEPPSPPATAVPVTVPEPVVESVPPMVPADELRLAPATATAVTPDVATTVTVASRRLSSKAIAIGAVAVVVLVVGGIAIGKVVWSGDDSSDHRGTSATASGSSSDDATDESDPQPTTDDSGEDVTPETDAASDSESEPAEETFTCWNGEARASQDLCPGLRGSTAMAWLFPSFHDDDSDGDCSPADLHDPITGVTKDVARGCDLTLSDGSTARIVYSQWSTFDQGFNHYSQKYGDVDYQVENGEMNGWNAERRPNGRFQGSRMFADTFPYSVTVDARSPADVAEGFTHVRIRPSDETAGYDSD